MRYSPKPHSGFTLLEMLVVLVIIGLLAGLVGPALFGNVDKAKVQTANTQIRMLKSAVGTFYLDVGRYPTTQEGLNALMNPINDEKSKAFWKGPYLAEDLPLDPWNNPYQYSVPGAKNKPFALYSFGADSQAGGEEFNADIGQLPAQ